MHSRKTAVIFVCLVFGLSLAAWPQQLGAQIRNPLAVRPTERVTARIDEQQRVTLRGHVHPLARPEYAIAAASQFQRMDRMVLVLNPDPTQEAALQELLREQQDRSSPNYHHWLTPESFGERFGISTADLEQVVNWLQLHGLEIDEIPPSRRSIIFSGTVGQVEQAFHTSIEKYRVRGKNHYANATEPEIPSALAVVVNGPAALNDFRSSPMNVLAPAPAFTSGGSHYLSPRDWNTIYDVAPLYGQGIDGTGQSIAVIGRVDISVSDVRTFRSNSGLPAKDPQIIVNGADPGNADSGDQFESSLDVEWAGAIAKNATVKFVTSASGASDGISLSAQYAVTHNVAPIITVSYGLCEAFQGASGNAFWASLWQQAASQGISVFVSAGDSGAAGCDGGSASSASYGRGVNGLCSSVYSTCVGGTQFNDTGNPSQYWSASNDSVMGSALSYIPELAWNESSSGGLWSTGGGASGVYSKPSWQAAPGVPADGKRDVPDVSMTAAIHDAYLVEMWGNLYTVGGTSASAPSLASLMALVTQNSGAQGNINPVLYSLASLQWSSSGAAVFHDVTGGNNSVPGATGYNAGTGYDLATGLGSVDATVLVNHWNDTSGSGFSLAPSASSVTVGAGSSGSVTLTESATGGFSSTVNLTASGAPSGTTVRLSSSTITSSAPVTVTITTAATTAAGNYTLTFTGISGVVSHSATVTLTVPAPTFTLTATPTSASLVSGNVSVALKTAAQTGFKSAVNLSVSGLPRGVTSKFVPASFASPGTGSSTLTLTVASGAATGAAGLTLTATGGGVTKTQSFTLTVVPPPTFTFTESATSASVVPGRTASVTLTSSGQNGLTSAVALSVSTLPKGVTASFSPASIASGTGSSTLTLTAASTAAGNANLTITAKAAGVTKTVTLSLTVLPPPNFAFSASATSASVVVGSSTTATLSTAGQNSFNTGVSLSVTGLPRGVTASFSPASIASPGSGSSTLTLNTASSAAVGKATLTITASGGGVKKTQTFALTVLAAPSLTVSQSATSVSVVVGSTGRATFSSSALNGFRSAVALSVSGLPAGVTGTFSPASIASPGTGSSTLTLSAATGTTAGTYSLTITASGGGITKTQPLALTIRAH